METTADTHIVVDGIQKCPSSLSTSQTIIDKQGLQNLLGRVASKLIDLTQSPPYNAILLASFRELNVMPGVFCCYQSVISKFDCLLIRSHVEGEGPF